MHSKSNGGTKGSETCVGPFVSALEMLYKQGVVVWSSSVQWTDTHALLESCTRTQAYAALTVLKRTSCCRRCRIHWSPHLRNPMFGGPTAEVTAEDLGQQGAENAVMGLWGMARPG